MSYWVVPIQALRIQKQKFLLPFRLLVVISSWQNIGQINILLMHTVLIILKCHVVTLMEVQIVTDTDRNSIIRSLNLYSVKFAAIAYDDCIVRLRYCLK